jgi:hypothetical protein
VKKVENYIKNNTSQFQELLGRDISKEIKKLEHIKDQIGELMKAGDEQAKLIHDKLRSKSKNSKSRKKYK